MFFEASRIVVRGLGGAGAATSMSAGACGLALTFGAGVSCELWAMLSTSGSLTIGVSTMVIFFLLGALSEAPFGLPRFFGAGSSTFSGGGGAFSSTFSGIVSFVSGIVSIVSAILTLLNIFFNQLPK
jgi:hypothetical protein